MSSSTTDGNAGNGDAPILLTRAAAAKLLSVSSRTFDRLLSRGVLPPPTVNLGRKLKRWRRDAIEAWAKS